MEEVSSEQGQKYILELAKLGLNSCYFSKRVRCFKEGNFLFTSVFG